MKITIDREGCTSCAACWEDYPEVFEESDGDGAAKIVAEFQVSANPAVGMVPVKFDDVARSAVEDCPAEVIHAE